MPPGLLTAFSKSRGICNSPGLLARVPFVQGLPVVMPGFGPVASTVAISFHFEWCSASQTRSGLSWPSSVGAG